ncbi:MAG: energy-coupling factor transporter transmembrane component T family protein [Candidatus Rariloculaceae bacterium]
MANFDLSYKQGDSLAHRMTPFSKLLIVLSVSFVAIFNTNLYVGAGLFILCFFFATFFSGVPLRQYWTFGKIIVPFVMILAMVFPFFYGGQATVGSDTIAVRTPIKNLSWAALGFGALLALRFLALATAGLTFAFTTHPTDLVQNLSRRGWDYRLVHAPVLGLILFPSFLKLGREISITQRIRDLGQDTNWLKRKWIRLKHLAFAMLVLGLRNGQTQAMALDIRGYGAHKTRTFMRKLPRHRGGEIFAWGFFVLSIVYLIVQFNPETMQWNMEL